MPTVKMSVLCLGLGLYLSALSSSVYCQKTQIEEPMLTQFCDLMANPKQGAVVRTTAIYRYGFEWSDLYCPGCPGVAWLEPSEKLKLNHSMKRKLKSSDVGRTVKVTVVGRMFIGGGYGHMGAYRFKFVVDRYEKIEVLLKESPVYSAIPESVKAKVNCSQ